ncbi:MAG: AsmA family protein [Deltaproteobacteria bacterium]|nr:AsmA family protein [Deltaproteobacteria bacterium]
MNRIVKWMLLAGGALLVLLVAAIVLIPLLMDVNRYKPQIEAKVQEATGRTFNIGGDIELSVFPWVGLSLSDLTLGSPTGFKETDMIKVGDFEARVKLIPLLSSNVEIKRVILQAPDIVLVKNKTGQTNWEFKTPASQPKKAAPAAKDVPTGDSGFALKSLTAEEIAIRNGRLTLIDHTSGKRQEVAEINLSLSDVSLDRPVALVFSTRVNGQPLTIEGTAGPIGSPPASQPIAYNIKISALDELEAVLKGSAHDLTGKPAFDLQLDVAAFSPRKLFDRLGQPFPMATADPAVLNKVSLKAQVKGDTTRVSLDSGTLVLDDTKTDVTLEAKAFDRPDLKFDVRMDAIDLDRYLPGTGKAPTDQTASPGTTKTAGKSTGPDYEPLRRMILDGQIAVGQLKAGKANMQNVRFQIAGRDGRFRIAPLACDLYGGAATITGTIDVSQSQPRSDLQVKLQKIAAGPMIKDVAQKEVLEGLLQSDITLQFQGDSPDRIKQTLNGGGQLDFIDGALVGIDLAAMVRNVQAAFGQGERITEKPKTDFSEFTIPFTLRNGTFGTDATRLQSPLLRVSAKGQADLVAEQLNFRVEPSLVKTIKGQGDTGTYEGIMVPVLVSGSFKDPRFAPDLEAIARQQVKKQIIDSGKLDEVFEKNENLKPLEETTKGLLKEIFK